MNKISVPIASFVEILELNVADEELVHVGEFLRLLHELTPDEEKFYAKGEKEVEEKIKKKK
jgi:rubrerythrin